MSLKPKSQDGSTNGVACMGSECDAADRLREVYNFGDISAPTHVARLLAGAHFRAARVFCRSQSPKLVNIYEFEYECSQLSANGHSRKRTALLTDAFSNPRFTSQSNSVFTHSRKRTLSRKRTQTLLKLKIGFFFCLRSLVSGHPMYNN